MAGGEDETGARRTLSVRSAAAVSPVAKRRVVYFHVYTHVRRGRLYTVKIKHLVFNTISLGTQYTSIV